MAWSEDMSVGKGEAEEEEEEQEEEEETTVAVGVEVEVMRPTGAKELLMLFLWQLWR